MTWSTSWKVSMIPVALGLTALTAISVPGRAAEGSVDAPAARVTEPHSGTRETAIFAGGCFWGVQGVFSHVKGVTATTAGYAGGSAKTAHYATVSTGKTRQAEAVKVTFDPRQIGYADLLRIYFSVVTDPTQGNRQGPDVGPQYRSALFPLTAAQAKVARAYLAQLKDAHLWKRPITTRIEEQHGFFPAEEHHQHFMAKNPTYPYIVINDRPKVEALKAQFPKVWKS